MKNYKKLRLINSRRLNLSKVCKMTFEIIENRIVDSVIHAQCLIYYVDKIKIIINNIINKTKINLIN